MANDYNYAKYKAMSEIVQIITQSYDRYFLIGNSAVFYAYGGKKEVYDTLEYDAYYDDESLENTFKAYIKDSLGCDLRVARRTESKGIYHIFRDGIRLCKIVVNYYNCLPEVGMGAYYGYIRTVNGSKIIDSLMNSWKVKKDALTLYNLYYMFSVHSYTINTHYFKKVRNMLKKYGLSRIENLLRTDSTTRLTEDKYTEVLTFCKNAVSGSIVGK